MPGQFLPLLNRSSVACIVAFIVAFLILSIFDQDMASIMMRIDEILQELGGLLANRAVREDQDISALREVREGCARRVSGGTRPRRRATVIP